MLILLQQVYVSGFVDPLINYVKEFFEPKPRKIAVFYSKQYKDEIQQVAETAKEELCKSVNDAVTSPKHRNSRPDNKSDCFIEVELIDEGTIDAELEILNDRTYVAVIGYTNSSITSERLEKYYCPDPTSPLIVFPFATDTAVKDTPICEDLRTLRLPRTNETQGEYIAKYVEAIALDLRNMKNASPSGTGKETVRLWPCKDPQNKEYSNDLFGAFKRHLTKHKSQELSFTITNCPELHATPEKQNAPYVGLILSTDLDNAAAALHNFVEAYDFAVLSDNAAPETLTDIEKLLNSTGDKSSQSVNPSKIYYVSAVQPAQDRSSAAAIPAYIHDSIWIVGHFLFDAAIRLVGDDIANLDSDLVTEVTRQDLVDNVAEFLSVNKRSRRTRIILSARNNQDTHPAIVPKEFKAGGEYFFDQNGNALSTNYYLFGYTGILDSGSTRDNGRLFHEVVFSGGRLNRTYGRASMLKNSVGKSMACIDSSRGRNYVQSSDLAYAAHSKLPCYTEVMVKAAYREGKEVKLMILDKLSEKQNHVIGLSPAAATKLGVEGLDNPQVSFRILPKRDDGSGESSYDARAGSN